VEGKWKIRRLASPPVTKSDLFVPSEAEWDSLGRLIYASGCKAGADGNVVMRKTMQRRG
jgi:hypothetical protein